MSCREIDINLLFHDDELPTKTMTPEEWEQQFRNKQKLILKCDLEDSSHDEEIRKLYEVNDKTMTQIADKLKLEYRFIKHRRTINKMVKGKG